MNEKEIVDGVSEVEGGLPIDEMERIIETDEEEIVDNLTEVEDSLLIDKEQGKDYINQELYNSSQLYKHEADLISQINIVYTDTFSWDIDNFKRIYSENKDKYEAISAETDMPPKLIAAIHYRESGCNFNTYLHNGDPLGKPTTHVPKGILFDNFTDGAIDAMSKFEGIRDDYKLTSDSKDMAAMLAFAEKYNGLGYYKHDRISPYVFSGSDVYKMGKYISDGTYDSTTIDIQPGVYLLISSLEE